LSLIKENQMLKKTVTTNPVRIFLSIVCLILGAIQWSNLQAAVVEDLYTVELPVADQTTTQRLQVFNQALREVIVKVSGSEEVLTRPDLERPLNNSSRYVRQFRYINKIDETAEAVATDRLYLRIVFNQELLEKLLRENNIPIWGKERPSTLMLISFDDNKNVSLVSGDTTPDVVDELDRVATHKGLPVLFPLLDLEDRLILGVKDVVQLNEANIQALADRYVPDVVLVGQIFGRVDDGWQASWQLRFGDRMRDWSYRAQNREDVIQQAIGQLAKTLATEYALQTFTNLDEVVLLRVDEVIGVAGYQRILTYLQSLDAVESVRLVLINGNHVTYRVSLRNSLQDLQQLISLGDQLEQLELPQVDATSHDQTVLMNYRFLR
jgi:uncharacterized protein